MQDVTANRSRRRYRLMGTALTGLALLIAGSAAQAGVDVRAPFTHVGVDRHHGVQVQAPFTNVHVGRGDRYRRGGYAHDSRRNSHGWQRSHRPYARHAPRYRDHHERRRWHRSERRDRGFFGRW